MRVRAKPKNSANTTSGSIALCAAAAIALLGMTPTNQSASELGRLAAAAPAVAARSDSARPSWRGTSENSSGATIAANAAQTLRMITKMSDRLARGAAGGGGVGGGVHADHHQRHHQRHHGHLQGVQPEPADRLDEVGDLVGQRRRPTRPAARPMTAPRKSPSSTRAVVDIMASVDRGAGGRSRAAAQRLGRGCDIQEQCRAAPSRPQRAYSACRQQHEDRLALGSSHASSCSIAGSGHRGAAGGGFARRFPQVGEDAAAGAAAVAGVVLDHEARAGSAGRRRRAGRGASVRSSRPPRRRRPASASTMRLYSGDPLTSMQ